MNTKKAGGKRKTPWLLRWLDKRFMEQMRLMVSWKIQPPRSKKTRASRLLLLHCQIFSFPQSPMFWLLCSRPSSTSSTLRTKVSSHHGPREVVKRIGPRRAARSRNDRKGNAGTNALSVSSSQRTFSRSHDSGTRHYRGKR